MCRCQDRGNNRIGSYRGSRRRPTPLLVRLNSATAFRVEPMRDAALIEMAFERSSLQHERGANEMKSGYRSRRPTWWSARNVSLGFESVSSGWVRSRRRSINQRSMLAYRGQWRHRSSSAGRASSVVAAVSDKIHAWQTRARSEGPLNSTAEADIFDYTRYRNSRA